MPAHWLPPGGKTKTPPLVVSFDCETVSVETDKGEAHRLRCWDAAVRDRTGSTSKVPPVDFYAGETAAELAELLELAAFQVPECWALAHNLGFDLTVTALPVVLAARGWELEFMNMGEESAIFSMERDRHKLVLTDSWSWLRCSLGEAAKDVRIHKLKLPENDAPLACLAPPLQARRRRSSTSSSPSSWTGGRNSSSATSASPGRHAAGAPCARPSPRRSILVGPEPFRTEFERRAIYGGRKEVYRVGTVTGTWIADYDIAAAYATTATAWPLPVVPRRFYNPITWEDIDNLSPEEGAIVECTVTTERPCAPVHVGDEVWWPTGTFRTTLTTPELDYVRKVATDVELHHGQVYKLSYALADWAGWIIHLLGDYSGSTPAVAKRVAKGWGRSVLGRFALRTSSLIGKRPATHLGWYVETGHDLDTSEALEVISFNGTEYTYRKDTPGPDSSPAVLAFVEGYVRRALGELLDTRNPRHILQVNTDGWWEQKAVRAAAWSMPGVPWPYTVTRRALENELLVVGPNHVQTPHERRFAGVPRDASVGDDESFAWSDWPGLRWQIEHSRPGEYLRPPKEMILREHYCRRWVLESGETVPVSCDVSPAGETVLLAWSRTALRRQDDVLATYQVPTLQELRDVSTGFTESPAAWTVVAPGRF